MEHEQGSHIRGNIPRLSRLPMPRASQDNLRSIRPIASVDSLRQQNGSALPRPSNARASGIGTPKPLGESINRSIKSRYWGTQGLPVVSKQPTIQQEQTSNNSGSLDTTPPGSKSVPPIYEDAAQSVASQDVVVDENATSKVDIPRTKRPPRPSLSERTAETLLHLSPSPSSKRRRSSLWSIESTMGPPSRPASVMNRSRSTRPETSLSLRSISPSKNSFIRSRAKSPAKEASQKPAFQLPNAIYTPPRAHVRGQSTHIARPPKLSTISSLSHHASAHESLANSVKELQTIHPTLSKPSKTAAERTSNSKPSLAAIFKDPPKLKIIDSKLDLSSLDPKPGLLKPKTRGENHIATSPSGSPVSSKSRIPAKSPATKRAESPSKSCRPSATLRAESPVKSSKLSATMRAESPVKKPKSSATLQAESPVKSSKSSATLRETIAKAKANATQKTTASTGAQLEQLSTFSGDSKELLWKRVQAASTSGILNIAAMGLKQIPDEVMKMYEFDPTGSTAWSETVDLVKFIAADNEISELRADSLPDWSVDDLIADETKSNQFGGLEVLDLHGNVLHEIPIGLRRLERLHTLNVSSNKLSLAAMAIVCQVTSLKELRLSNNQLSGTLLENISQLVNLEVLDLSSNQLEGLPSSISSLKKLRKLNISGNKISNLPTNLLISMPLVEIDASKNKISGVLFNTEGTFEQLQFLDISHNALEAITAGSSTSMPRLVTLAVDQNRLATMPDLSGATKLATLTASDNNLTELPTGFTQLHALTNANFSNNKIKSLEAQIARMENLVSLNVTGNPLSERKYLTMQTQDLKIALARCIKIDGPDEETTFSSNLSSATDAVSSTSTCTIHAPQNGVLDLRGKSLSSIDLSILTLTSPIHTLNLSANNLSIFPLSLLTHPMLQFSLHTLDLSHNPLLASAYLTEGCFLPALRILNLVSTGLTSLDALTAHLRAPELRELNISCHRLSGHLPWVRAWWPSLTTLLATDNWFSSVDVEAVRGLEVLDVRNNEIEALPPKMGMLGVNKGKGEGRLRNFECSGNRFRVPRWQVVEKGTEAVLRDLRRMVPAGELEGEWADE